MATTRTSVQIKTEIFALQQELNRTITRENEVYAEAQFKKLDAYLKIAVHTYGNCNDERPVHPRDCVRCALLRVQRDGYWTENLRVTLTL